ncbi:unnamed protein product [Prorocentrum cordatum]|uniref:Uncharacterized protein n=1 Tax=Prorocentrum cordatum TaxID=2364126 RepID=A0ABN9SN17_9DINO|nr:unnamed protein product [Polarella glacialis]
MPRQGLVSCTCWLACFVLTPISAWDEAERMRRFCQRHRGYAAARNPGDLNATFEPILRGEVFQEYSPRIHSTDPWVVYFEELLSEAEVQALEANMFDHKAQEFFRSGGGVDGRHQYRNSETAMCEGRCDEDPSIRRLRERASKISRAPVENFALSEALRYRDGMFTRNTTTTDSSSTTFRAGLGYTLGSYICQETAWKAAPPSSRGWT